MNRCPISYELTEGTYSASGLKRLSRSLTHLEPFPYSAEEQVREGVQQASKISIQGVQPKLSTVLNVKKGMFEIVDRNGRYILKPQNQMFPELPQNEDLSMRMAKLAGIEVPVHGLIYSKDKSLTYFIKRFDRVSRNNKFPVEDLSQITERTRETKYGSSMEKVADAINTYCTFPAVEKIKLFRLTLFNFLIGNEDMHLKNFSLIFRNHKVEMSPAYDLLNTTIAIENPVEEIALPIAGKKRKLSGELLIDYYGRERLGLNHKVISKVIADISRAFSQWEHLIEISFLSEPMKSKYKDLLKRRKAVLILSSMFSSTNF